MARENLNADTYDVVISAFMHKHTHRNVINQTTNRQLKGTATAKNYFIKKNCIQLRAFFDESSRWFFSSMRFSLCMCLCSERPNYAAKWQNQSNLLKTATMFVANTFHHLPCAQYSIHCRSRRQCLRQFSNFGRYLNMYALKNQFQPC